jgi:hypothetical protein
MEREYRGKLDNWQRDVPCVSACMNVENKTSFRRFVKCIRHGTTHVHQWPKGEVSRKEVPLQTQLAAAAEVASVPVSMQNFGSTTQLPAVFECEVQARREEFIVQQSPQRVDITQSTAAKRSPNFRLAKMIGVVLCDPVDWTAADYDRAIETLAEEGENE